MKITLLIDGEEKIFITGFVKARFLRKALEIRQATNFDNLSIDEVDNLVAFTCEVFDNQFTIDQFYDGISLDDLYPTLIDVLQRVLTGNISSEGTDEKNV